MIPALQIHAKTTNVQHIVFKSKNTIFTVFSCEFVTLISVNF